MEMLGLKETAVQMAKANRMRWCGHVMRRDDGHVLRKALEFEVRGQDDQEDVEDVGGEGEQKRCFGEKECHESSEMENGS